VAWADGSVNEKEEQAILDSSIKIGFAREMAILKEWLHNKPDAKFLDAWKAYMKGLSEEISRESMQLLTADLLQDARDVAKISGGFLGLVNPVSPSEKKMLDEIEAFFKGL
jgi:hypothetical protein